MEVVSWPENLSNINVVHDSNNVNNVIHPLVQVQKSNWSVSPAFLVSSKKKQPNSSNSDDDPATEVIDAHVKGKALPPKGRLLKSVMEAGPLLQTFLVASSLPKWRNPPPLQLQPIKIPPFTIKDIEKFSLNFDQKFAANMGNSSQKLAPVSDSSSNSPLLLLLLPKHIQG